ncbi:MAG: NYN domain-containing protein [Sphingobacteriales bacterium]|nr:NYN domain-containing protein [Sphingobacteriales bacterium]
MNENNNNVAIYLDFENLALSADTVYPSKTRPLLIEPIVDYATTKGNIAIKRAYADWSKTMFMQYQSMLMQQGFELVHLPETNSQGKNGSDVRLAIDVMEHLEMYPKINTIVIGSGDSDFVPLIQRVRMRSKEVIAMGFEHSVGRLVKINSVEFKPLEELLGRPEEASPISDLLAEPLDPTDGKELLMRFIKSRSSEEPVSLYGLKQDLIRLDSSFSEKRMGFNSFRQFVESFKDLVEKVEKDDRSKASMVYFKEGVMAVAVKTEAHKDVRKEAAVFLKQVARYQKNIEKRKILSKVLFDMMQEKKAMSMTQMTEALDKKLKDFSRIDIRKYINTLFEGKALKNYNQNTEGPLLQRPMIIRPTINNADILEQVYIGGISFILKDKYPTLESEDIRNLLGLPAAS